MSQPPVLQPPPAQPPELDPPPLAYQTPQLRSFGPPNAALFWISFLMSVLAGVVGLFLFIGYAISREDGFAVLGLIWLYAGGFLTFAAGIISLVYLGIAISRKFAGAGTVRRSILLIVLPILNVVIAIICSVVGLEMVFEPAKPTATTSTTTYSASR